MYFSEPIQNIHESITSGGGGYWDSDVPNELSTYKYCKWKRYRCMRAKKEFQWRIWTEFFWMSVGGCLGLGMDMDRMSWWHQKGVGNKWTYDLSDHLMVNLDNVNAPAYMTCSMDMNTYKLHLKSLMALEVEIGFQALYTWRVIFFPHTQLPYAYHVAFSSLTLFLCAHIFELISPTLECI